MIGSYVLHQGAGELYQRLVHAMGGNEKGNNKYYVIIQHKPKDDKDETVVLLFITQCYSF